MIEQMELVSIELQKNLYVYKMKGKWMKYKRNKY